ncbi:3D domain-containing protein [Clostridium cylindrosporum]|uniref:3D domain-containing protein n=1 Tax=Clostridium cylindrosporum DSM 605 TaxID=1121307 RepID=A0A0J8G5K1_CLOCY|nr:3D domain-containing protein [Clostridium cylindrosporum]KMT22931.1 3D domain-containing protein [Clostridium cylindrosporum DSM 605]
MTKLKETLKGPSGQKILIASLILMLVVSFFVIAGKRKKVTLAYDGRIDILTTNKSTVKGLIEAQNIVLDKEDKISHSLDSNLEKDMKISIKRAVPIKVEEAGKLKEIKTTATTVSDMLKEEKLSISALDKINPGVTAKIQPNMKINITRVTEKLEANSETIPYTIKKQDDKSLSPGTTKVVKEGANGRREIVFKSVYENGKLISKQKIEEKIVVKPVNKLIASGPKKVVLTASRGGLDFTYKSIMTMTATAYSQAPYDPTGGGSITASGTKVIRNPKGISTVAVDPRVIPLGTKVYVEGYGMAIASDTGGAIKGNKIDLYFNPGSEYERWGKKTVKVYIIK